MTCRPVLIVVTLALAMTACGTIRLGRDFDIHTFSSAVIVGKTTQREVQAWLGPPVSTGAAVHADGSHSEKWTYYYGYGRLPGLKGAGIKLLEIEFDQHGQVYSYNWSQ